MEINSKQKLWKKGVKLNGHKEKLSMHICEVKVKRSLFAFEWMNHNGFYVLGCYAWEHENYQRRM